MKRRFKGKNIKLFKFFDENSMGSLPRTFICSLILIFFFYSAPELINFTNQQVLKNKGYQNNSKAILAYTLNKKENGIETDNDFLDERDLLVDIFSLNDLETDTVRLDASTIKQLFDDTN